VDPEYRDHRYDTLHRHEPGRGSPGPYVDTSGHNEFVALKVAHDDSSLYFCARTRYPITPRTDPNWMLLFINADVSFDFHWADNIPCSGQIEGFLLDGDGAPLRRFDYRYRD
jgi:hypothetical protein